MTRCSLLAHPVSTYLFLQARFNEYLAMSSSFLTHSMEQGSVDALPVVSAMSSSRGGCAPCYPGKISRLHEVFRR